MAETSITSGTCTRTGSGCDVGMGVASKGPRRMLMLAEATNSTRQDVLAAIKQASAATGSDFQYLLGTAMRESGLKPSAKAPTSSASGLFQFTQQTWLGMV